MRQPFLQHRQKFCTLQFAGILRMRSMEKITAFLDSMHTGRIASIDENGFPQIIPMNYVFLDGFVYMHSHTRGEKLDNIRRNNKVGFEVDHELEFLPSYFSDPYDASLADTLYISVVIKGSGTIIQDKEEKAKALNGLMVKYQPEGGYTPIHPQMKVIDAVSIIRVRPDTIHGKYKIGQHLKREDRFDLAQKILTRGLPTARKTLYIMGFEVVDDNLRMIDEPVW